MANEKLTWLELRKAVAEYAHISEQEAEQFLNAFLDGIMQGLKTDKQVKIKGLGSFTLKPVAPRKSVNIATGEAFTIEGYNKLTFSAESMLKESVEKRIEQPKSETLMAELSNDPIKKLGEQATEIVDLLAELGQAPNTPEIPTPEQPSEPIETEEPSSPEIPEEPLIPEEPSNTEEQEEEPIEQPAPQPTEVTNTPNKRCSWLCWTIVALLLAIIVGAGIYCRDTIIQWWQCLQECQPTTTEGVVQPEIIIEEVIEQPAVIRLADIPREYVNFLGIEKVGKDSRLAWIAYKYYAQKDLWVFIYEANRDIISHPTHVRPGQYIRIPDLEERYRNLYDPELRQLVDSLAVEYLSIKN